MRLYARLAALVTASLLTVGSIATFAGSADAAPLPTLTGSAPATAHGPGVVTFSYTLTLPVDAATVQFSTHQPIALPALGTDVTVDGTAVPAADVTEPSAVDISFPLTTAPAPVIAGTHVITFTAQVGTGASVVASSTASVAVDGAPTPIASPAVPVAVNQPDLSITYDADDSDPLPGTIASFGTGQETDLAYDVENLGYGTPDTLLALTLPAGLQLGEDGIFSPYIDNVQCAAQADARHLLCDVGAVPHNAGDTDPEIDIELVATAAAPAGTNAELGLAVAPAAGQGVDTTPANNTVSTAVHFAGTAALSYTITPAKPKVALGSTTTVSLTVHNAGPQPATEAGAIAVLLGKNFTITHFSGKQDPSDGFFGGGGNSVTVSSSASASAPAQMRHAVASAADAPSAAFGDPGSVISGLSSADAGLLWDIGTIPSGKSVTAVLTVKAVKLGTTKIGLVAGSDAGNPNCPELNCQLTTASIQAVPVPVVTTPATRSTQPVLVTTGPQLANTGSASRPVLGLAVLLLLAGGALAVIGRRRNA